MKKPNLSKKDIVFTTAFAAAGAAAGLLISKTTTKKSEVTAEVEGATCEDPLDEVATSINPDVEGEGAFVPPDHIHYDGDGCEV